jgi:hypothetical protein
MSDRNINILTSGLAHVSPTVNETYKIHGKEIIGGAVQWNSKFA